MTEPTVPADETRLVERVRIRDALFIALDKTEGYRANQLAEAAGVTNATLSSMKKQGRDVRISTLQRILDAMPIDVYLRFYKHLGAGLVQQDALAQAETSTTKVVEALLPFCDDESLIRLARSLGALSKARHDQGSQVISVVTLLLELMQYCELEDIPELISSVGKYTSTAINKAEKNLSKERS